MTPHIKTEYRLLSHAGKLLIEERQYTKSRILGPTFGYWGPWHETYNFETGLSYRDATVADYTAAMERLRQRECELRKDPVVLLTSLPTDCK